ncbi:hypothetical protein G9P44_006316 [Scheffersomyces stipitis]|nr:hypothetical protein G9P44_006316 [Scheffersomyces stipitis]
MSSRLVGFSIGSSSNIEQSKTASHRQSYDDENQSIELSSFGKRPSMFVSKPGSLLRQSLIQINPNSLENNASFDSSALLSTVKNATITSNNSSISLEQANYDIEIKKPPRFPLPEKANTQQEYGTSSTTDEVYYEASLVLQQEIVPPTSSNSIVVPKSLFQTHTAIDSLPTKYYPTLLSERIPPVVSVQIQPQMRRELSKDSTPLDYKKLSSSFSFADDDCFAAPLCERENASHEEQALLHILELEMENLSPSGNMKKDFWKQFVTGFMSFFHFSTEDYYEMYPWAKYTIRDHSVPSMGKNHEVDLDDVYVFIYK